MESRYPTLKPIHEQFKIKGEDIYRDPLGSSGVTKFVYAICRTVLRDLKEKVDLSSVRERFMSTYGHMDDKNRFVTLAFSGSLEDFFDQ